MKQKIIRTPISYEEENDAHNVFQKRSVIICNKCNSISFPTSSCGTTNTMNIAAQRTPPKKKNDFIRMQKVSLMPSYAYHHMATSRKFNLPFIFPRTFIIYNCLNTYDIKSLQKTIRTYSQLTKQFNIIQIFCTTGIFYLCLKSKRKEKEKKKCKGLRNSSINLRTKFGYNPV